MASCPPSAAPIAQGEPGSLGSGVERVVRALAVRSSDRVDRRQVEDVEAHRGDRGQPLGGGAEGAALPGAVGVQRRRPRSAGRTRTRRRRRRACARPGSSATAWRSRARRAGGPADRRECRVGRDGEGIVCGSVRIGQSLGDLRSAACALAWGGSCPSRRGRAGLGAQRSITSTSTPAAIFSSAACGQVAKSSAYASTRNVQAPRARPGRRRPPAVGAGVSGVSRCRLSSRCGVRSRGRRR